MEDPYLLCLEVFKARFSDRPSLQIRWIPARSKKKRFYRFGDGWSTAVGCKPKDLFLLDGREGSQQSVTANTSKKSKDFVPLDQFLDCCHALCGNTTIILPGHFKFSPIDPSRIINHIEIGLGTITTSHSRGGIGSSERSQGSNKNATLTH